MNPTSFHGHESLPEGLGDGPHGDADLYMTAGLHFRRAAIHHLHSFQNISFTASPYINPDHARPQASSIYSTECGHNNVSTYDLLDSSPEPSHMHTGLETLHIKPFGTAHTNRQPVEYLVGNPKAYTLIHPFFAHSIDEETQRQLEAWMLYRIHHRRVMSEFCPTLAQPTPMQEADKHILVLGSVPWAPLHEGVNIECISKLVGPWRATAHLDSRHDMLCNLWRCDGTEQQAWVWVHGHFKTPPSLYKRLKVGVKWMKKRLFALRSKNKSVQTTREIN
ncbi:hypothetical protein B0H17DRAFT_1148219 [Mycena rosella]|uniref:Uncharacterized protein n=1 Tax=Mycena rosella TaxID=1033263 RepID=A0AAD7CDE7_MYCRO|nr:hypothetical protein B0H17DRAFT_1148219 [Mycena rosella]